MRLQDAIDFADLDQLCALDPVDVVEWLRELRDRRQGARLPIEKPPRESGPKPDEAGPVRVIVWSRHVTDLRFEFDCYFALPIHSDRNEIGAIQVEQGGRDAMLSIRLEHEEPDRFLLAVEDEASGHIGSVEVDLQPDRSPEP